MHKSSSIQCAGLSILAVLLAGACNPAPQYPGATLSATPASETPQAEQTVFADSHTPLPTTTSQPTATTTPTATDILEAVLETALVVQVLDGDTLEVIVDGSNYRLRYIGIDCPEDGQPYSTQAEAINRQLVEGKKVVLEKDISETDRYDRLLRYVYLLDGTFVNAELVRTGMARAAAYPPDTRYQNLFEELQMEAQAAEEGIWGQPEATATLPAVEGSLFIDPACSQFNAPGNDNDNKIEEFVCLSNQTTATIDLSAWTLRDEYGWQYTFPAFSLESGMSVRIRTGCGTDTAQDLHWCREETAIWNNDTDCAYLLDTAGEVVQMYCY